MCIRHRGRVIASIAVVVRDVAWRTVPGRMDATAQRVEEGRRWRVQGVHEAGGLGLGYVGEAFCDDDGAGLRFTSTHVSPGEYGRIGLCVLLPSELAAGCRYVAGAGGTTAVGRLPVSIAPHPLDPDATYPLIGPFESLTVELGDGTHVSFTFAGPSFELEDQRNWSDASFKVYSSPTGAGPEIVGPGETIEQAVTCRIAGVPDPVVCRPSRRSPTQLRVAGGPVVRLPSLGVALPRDGAPDPVAALRSLGPHHVALRLAIAERRWVETLMSGAHVADVVGLPLELTVELSGEPDWHRLASVVQAAAPRRVLVAHAGGVRAAAGAAERLTALGMAGVFAHASFYELNAAGRELQGCAVAWPLTPQVHAFDDASIMSTLPTQGLMLSQLLRELRPSQLAVAPVEWTPRDMAGAAGTLPRLADPRLHADIAAAWLVGSVCALAATQPVSATYFETSGERGLLPGHPRDRTPAAQVFQAAARAVDHPVRLLAGNTAGVLAGFVVEDPSAPWALLANLLAHPQEVELGGIAASPERTVTLAPYEVIGIDDDGRCAGI